MFLLTNCAKDELVNEEDPSNLTIEIVFIDHELKEIELIADAQNVIQYQLYIDDAQQAVDENTTGLFNFTFDDYGLYNISVKAFGNSGKYIKTNKLVEINSGEPNNGIPLNRGYFTPLEYDGYDLLWQDEFTGSTLNAENWSYDIGNGNWGWGNNELEYYRAENAWVSDSVLTIEARQESYGGFSYTSAKIKTYGKKSFQYGRIDIRALLPEGQGIWPALWTLGDNLNSAGWPDCGEIDIMENIGDKNTVYAALHWEYEGSHADAGGSKTLPSSVYNFAEAYHVFSVFWDENSIKWYVDDQKYHEINISGGDMSEFHQSHWFIFNVAVGGNWPGNPDASTVFPQQMKVDYIRVFNKN